MKLSALHGRDLYRVADLLQSANEARGAFLRIGTIEVSAAEFAPFGAVAQHVPDGGDHRSGHRHDGFLGAATGESPWFHCHEPAAEIAASIRISIDDEIALGVQSSRLRIGHVATNLQHPRLVWSRRNAGDVHNAIGKTDNEQQIVGDEALRCPYLNRQEITGSQHFPMGLEKR